MRVLFRVFEDDFPDRSDAPRAHAPDGLLAWFREAARAALAAIPPDGLLPPAPETLPAGDAREVTVWLCSRETMSDVFGHDGCLGLHLVSTPDTDSFRDDSPSARALRLLVVSDETEIRARLVEEIAADGPAAPGHVGEYEEAEIATAFHEIAHAVLFATNSNLNSPHDVEAARERRDCDFDLFDMSSGYGIRPLPGEDGSPVWADDLDEARDMMEAWCERTGREWARALPIGPDPESREFGLRGFYAAAGVSAEAEIDRALRDEPEPG
ncbi:MAG: hypothetical protein DI635_16175 [Pseudoxanthomonas suwonensis]|nr:MAG: hypothetical protein DI635_16175 [Pseudoxanthomonas suwonensis]